MYRLISVPLDGTTDSRHALPTAILIAQRTGCEIELIQVAFPPGMGTELYGAAVLEERDIEEMRRAAEEQLQAAAAAVEPFGVRATPVAITGASLSETLAAHLHQSKPDLVVMTTHHRNRLERLLLGSVAESIVRGASTPVLLLRPVEGEPDLAHPPAMKHVLIPLDGSSFAESVVPHATRLAETLGAEVTLFSVLEPAPAAAAAAAGLGGGGMLSVPDAGEGSSLDAELLERAAQLLRTQGLIVQATALVDGQPARAIVDYASKRGIDLIAMTTHGRGALKRLVAGSISEKVLRSWPGAMLMYRPELH